MPGTASISSLCNFAILELSGIPPAAVPKIDTAANTSRGGYVHGCYVNVQLPNAVMTVDFQKVTLAGPTVSMSPGNVPVDLASPTYFNGANSGSIWIPVDDNVAATSFSQGDVLQITVTSGNAATTFVSVWFETSNETPTPLTVTVVP